MTHRVLVVDDDADVTQLLSYNFRDAGYDVLSANDGMTAVSLAHRWLPETIAQLHAQGALAVASHPHVFKSEWGKNTLYLWENQDEFAPLLDAWEIANRNDIFAPVALLQAVNE
jgi:CheY-like chemotaxis protein